MTLALPPAIAILVDDLRSPDPSVRDTGAFTALAGLAEEGALDENLVELGDLAVSRLADPDVQTRSFGALLLALVVDRDNRTGRADDDAVRRWVAPASTWYVDESDTRGWDATLGWLHAVAHGADALGELAASPRLGRDELAGLLNVLLRRAVASTDQPWLQNEDDRVALAVMGVLRRDVLGPDEVCGALDVLAGGWRDAEPGPVTTTADNALRLTRTLYVQLSLGVRAEPGAEVVHPVVRADALHALGNALAGVHWFYGRPV